MLKVQTPTSSPPETLDSETYNSLGYPQELVSSLQKHGLNDVKSLREWIVSGNDVSTISADYADIILASLSLGKDQWQF